jgi:alkaline phosphatase D
VGSAERLASADMTRDPTVGRRRFLGAMAVAGVAAACSDDGPTGATDGSVEAGTVADLPDDPFTLGVASGDPTASSVILWTRLALDPTVADGAMPAQRVSVEWEVATDEEFGDVVAGGTAAAVGPTAHSVHVDADGLPPDSWYWYRFSVGAWTSPVGRTRTVPEPGGPTSTASIAHVSCQRIDQGWFVALRDLADTGPDVVVHCGDYVYEQATAEGIRPGPAAEATDLDGYRTLHALYKQDVDLQAAHAAAPWLVTWDDHEVDDNYRAGTPDGDSTTLDPEVFLARRADAYQAWWEHMPVRLDPPDGPDLTMYRSVRYGDLAHIHLLDTRQYRTPIDCGATNAIGARCAESLDPATTVLGADQEAWLASELAEGGPRWNVLTQQIVLHQWRFTQGEDAVWNLDQWDGYPVARDRLLAELGAAPAAGVVLTGDVHSSWVAQLLQDFDDEGSSPVGVEFVAPGVASKLPAAAEGLAELLPANNSHIRFAESGRRGWVHHTVSHEGWTAEYRLVADADRADSPVEVAATWAVDPGGELTPA